MKRLEPGSLSGGLERRENAPVHTRCAASTRRPKVSAHTVASGAKPAPVMATSRPPGPSKKVAFAERPTRIKRRAVPDSPTAVTPLTPDELLGLTARGWLTALQHGRVLSLLKICSP